MLEKSAFGLEKVKRNDELAKNHLHVESGAQVSSEFWSIIANVKPRMVTSFTMCLDEKNTRAMSFPTRKLWSKHCWGTEREFAVRITCAQSRRYKNKLLNRATPEITSPRSWLQTCRRAATFYTFHMMSVTNREEKYQKTTLWHRHTRDVIKNFMCRSLFSAAFDISLRLWIKSHSCCFCGSPKIARDLLKLLILINRRQVAKFPDFWTRKKQATFEERARMFRPGPWGAWTV